MTGTMFHRAGAGMAPAISQAEKRRPGWATQGPPGTSAESYYHLLVAATCRSWRPVSVALLTTRMR